jgi:hypothetical protein
MSCLVVGRERKEKKEKAQEVKADRIVKAQARKRSAASRSEACAIEFCSLLVASQFTKKTNPVRWLLVTSPYRVSICKGMPSGRYTDAHLFLDSRGIHREPMTPRLSADASYLMR